MDGLFAFLGPFADPEPLSRCWNHWQTLRGGSSARQFLIHEVSKQGRAPWIVTRRLGGGVGTGINAAGLAGLDQASSVVRQHFERKFRRSEEPSDGKFFSDTRIPVPGKRL